ncbi:MAG: type IV pilus biogenesis/stability protein PilW [Pseudomonadales bacterium]|nr:type IV pilus biogenesis/stability protein PilW [Pseudomonadales bacterium]
MNCTAVTKGVFLTVMFTLLAACVTETTGPVKKPIDRAKQLETLVKLGLGYIQNGEYARAKDNLTRALAIDPKSAEALSAFGLVFAREGEIDLAELYFKRAVAAAPNFTAARNNYGAFLYAQNRYSEAVEQLSVASADRLYKRRAQVFENLGVSYMRLGHAAEARAALLRSIQLNPGQSRALLELAEIQLAERDYVQARAFYRRHLKISSQSARSLWVCIRVARIFDSEDQEASCALTLSRFFPGTAEFEQYKLSLVR